MHRPIAAGWLAAAEIDRDASAFGLPGRGGRGRPTISEKNHARARCTAPRHGSPHRTSPPHARLPSHQHHALYLVLSAPPNFLASSAPGPSPSTSLTRRRADLIRIPSAATSWCLTSSRRRSPGRSPPRARGLGRAVDRRRPRSRSGSGTRGWQSYRCR